MQPHEITPENRPSQIEGNSEKPAPQLERTPQAAPVNNPVPSPVPPVGSAPAVPTPPPVSSSAPLPASSSPLTAKDSDEIESTWVDQVDTIIEKNQNDPYNQEEAAEAVSKDYLHKRFGIDVEKS